MNKDLTVDSTLSFSFSFSFLNTSTIIVFLIVGGGGKEIKRKKKMSTYTRQLPNEGKDQGAVVILSAAPDSSSTRI